MNAKKVIKRYHNRKLYDTSDSTYVTLEDIADLIKRGAEVQIIDNRTKEDITGQTLAQIIFEEEKKKRSSLPLSILRNLIQSGEEAMRGIFKTELSHVKTFVEEKVKPTIESVQSIPAVHEELKKLAVRLESLEKKVKK